MEAENNVTLIALEPATVEREVLLKGEKVNQTVHLFRAEAPELYGSLTGYVFKESEDKTVATSIEYKYPNNQELAARLKLEDKDAKVYTNGLFAIGLEVHVLSAAAVDKQKEVSGKKAVVKKEETADPRFTTARKRMK